MTAETLAASDAVDNAFMVKRMMEEVLNTELPAIQVATDSKSLFDCLKTSNVIADKRLMIDMAAMREMTDRGEITVKWVQTEDQLADVWTNAGANKSKLLNVMSSGKLGFRQ